MENDERRSFRVTYRDGVFSAYQFNDDGTQSRIEASPDLKQLFQICRERGLNHLYSLSEDAIDEIYEWLVKIKPVSEYVDSIWEGESSVCRQIGFRLPEPND